MSDRLLHRALALALGRYQFDSRRACAAWMPFGDARGMAGTRLPPALARSSCVRESLDRAELLRWRLLVRLNAAGIAGRFSMYSGTNRARAAIQSCDHTHSHTATHSHTQPHAATHSHPTEQPRHAATPRSHTTQPHHTTTPRKRPSVIAPANPRTEAGYSPPAPAASVD